MAKRVNSTMIGMFVVGSLALAIAALIVLGSGHLFRRPHRFVCFFGGSLNGLKVGAPVKFRGVQIGTVEQIMLRLPLSYGTVKPQPRPELPVIVDIDESQLKRWGGTGEALKPRELDLLIKRGMRAQLNMESLLTGVLFIELDFHPGTPVHMVLEPGAQIREIPTVPTDLAQVQEKLTKALSYLEQVDFVAVAKSITDAANAMKDLAGSPELKATLTAFRQDAITLNATLVSIRRLSENFNAKTGPLLVSLQKTSKQAQAAMEQMSSTMTVLKTTVAPDSPLAYRLNTALENLSSASNSIRQLADYLQRNPSALVRGKYTSDHAR
jgi:phospholipid/cholesterol/gamma-HCH transport system substrate-binding protein